MKTPFGLLDTSAPESRRPGAALVAGTVIFSFGELVFSSAVPAAVARLAPPGSAMPGTRRPARQAARRWHPPGSDRVPRRGA